MAAAAAASALLTEARAPFKLVGKLTNGTSRARVAGKTGTDAVAGPTLAVSVAVAGLRTKGPRLVAGAHFLSAVRGPKASPVALGGGLGFGFGGPNGGRRAWCCRLLPLQAGGPL